MRLILIHTCGAEASVALADTAAPKQIVAATSMPAKTASERLVAAVRHTLDEAAWRLPYLDAIAVVTGPGSFTGVRVGLSAAKGFSEASGVPILGLSRLALLAGPLSGPLSGPLLSGPLVRKAIPEQTVCALLDAGRGEFYCGIGVTSHDWQESLLGREYAIIAASTADQVIVCEQAVLSQLTGDLPQLSLVAEPTAADALPLTLQRIETAGFDDPMTLDASYLRRTDTELFGRPVRGTQNS